MNYKKVSDIIGLDIDYVRISNEQQLIKKIDKIVKDGRSKLQIVTDFDLTLTKFAMSDGDTRLTTWDMFWSCPSMPQSCKDKDKELIAIYRPKEQDATLTSEQRTEYIVEWYEEAINQLRGVTFPRNELRRLANELAGKAFRDGVGDMITWSRDHEVPVLVFSAGQGDSVKYIMEEAQFLHPDKDPIVKVISNFLHTDDNDKIIGLKGPVIHTENKNETAVVNTDYYEMVRPRRNAVVIGDNMADARMADGMDCEVVLRIGLNGRGDVEGKMNKYLEKFDIVLVGNPSFEVVNSILNLIH